MNKLLMMVLTCAVAMPAAAFDFGNLEALKGKVQEVQRVQKEVKTATEDVSEPQEIEMGGGIASNVLGAAPLLKNRKVQQYVNDVGRWLTLQTERPDLPWKFAVLDDEDVNAFAAPGGYVLIT